MPDYFDSASQSIDQTKRALLSAIAQQGTAGQEAMQRAQADIAAQKQAAIAAALGSARGRGAPQAAMDEVSNTIGGQYDRRLADLTQSSAQRKASMDHLSASAGTYMDQAQTAIPVLRSNLAEKIADLRYQGEQERARMAQDAADRNADRELQKLSFAIRQEELAAAKEARADARARAARGGGGGGGGGVGVNTQLQRLFGGKEGFGQYIEDAMAAVDKQSRGIITRTNSGVGPKGESGMPNPLGVSFLLEAKDHVPEQVGRELGFERGVASSLFSQYQRGLAADDQRALADDAYERAASFAAEMLDSGDRSYTQQAFARDITQLPGMTPAAAAKVISQYRTLFPDANDLEP